MPIESTFHGSSLWVVGNINRDLKTARFPASNDLFTDGETSVSSIVETIGGGGANSAFAAASLGAQVTFLGKVGADGLGDRLQRTLIQHGIRTYLKRDESHPSGTSLALSFDNGHRHFVSCLPANEALSFDDLDLHALPGQTHLLRADVWFSDAMLFGGNRQLFETAQKAGAAVSLDLNWDPQWGRASAPQIRARKQAVRDLLPLVNLAHGNVRELMEFAEAADLDTALQRLADWGADAVVVHLGAQGAGYYYPGSELIVEPPAPVHSQINTTGTGDVLSMCMMLLHHRADISIRERLRIANTVVAEFMDGRLNLIPPLAD
ncbi:MAG: carbohydrate kinase family protein [Chthoniobacter sp.]|nr:carbohydrate kinase family protein [Chthoniobacter sp.]